MENFVCCYRTSKYQSLHVRLLVHLHSVRALQEMVQATGLIKMGRNIPQNGGKNSMGKIDKKARAKTIRSIYEKQDKSKRSAIRKTIQNLKGKRFTDTFICDLCKHTRMTGYLYETEEREYEICKFCYDAIHDIRPHTKVLYTPMGNKR